MRFEANWRCYSNRYFGGLIVILMALLFILIRPLSAGQDFRFFELFNDMFLTDLRLTLSYLSICCFAQVILYLTSGCFSRYVVVDENEVVFRLFNKKTYKLKYSELSSVENSKGICFLFTFKDGRQQKISNSVKNSELAFKMIQKKIAEANG